MCDVTHGVGAGTGVGSFPMEWMLQVVDELDDAVCVVKQRWLGFGCEVGGYLQAGMTVAAVGAAFAAGLGIAS